MNYNNFTEKPPDLHTTLHCLEESFVIRSYFVSSRMATNEFSAVTGNKRKSGFFESVKIRDLHDQLAKRRFVTEIILPIEQKLMITQKLLKWDLNGIDAMRKRCWELSVEEWTNEFGFTPNMHEDADRVQELFDSIGIGDKNGVDYEYLHEPDPNYLHDPDPNYPKVGVIVNYSHPLVELQGIPVTNYAFDSWDDPYKEETYKWKIDMGKWNSFFSERTHMSPDAWAEQWTGRERHIKEMKVEYLEDSTRPENKGSMWDQFINMNRIKGAHMSPTKYVTYCKNTVDDDGNPRNVYLPVMFRKLKDLSPYWMHIEYSSVNNRLSWRKLPEDYGFTQDEGEGERWY